MPEAAFAALERIYRDLEDELRALAPVCRARGDCCEFSKAGHELWTTPLEFDYLLSHDAAGTRRPLDGTCPFLRTDRRCGVRDRRMLGCRIYFCDPAHKERMGPLYEKYLARIKAVMRESGIAYEYFRFMDRIGGRLAGPLPPRE